MTSEPCVAVNWRARCRVLLTTPVRLRRTSRKSRATRGRCFVQDSGQIASQRAAVEPGDFGRIAVFGAAGAMYSKCLIQGARNGCGVARWGEPAAARFGQDVGGRRVGRGDGQDGSAEGQVLEELAGHGGFGA